MEQTILSRQVKVLVFLGKIAKLYRRFCGIHYVKVFQVQILLVALIVAIYGGIYAILAPLLSTLGVFVLGAALLVSLITALWVCSVFQSDDFAEPSSRRILLSDVRYAIIAAMLVPSPYAPAALAFVWLYESKPTAALMALIVAGIFAVVVARMSFISSMGRGRNTAP